MFPATWGKSASGASTFVNYAIDKAKIHDYARMKEQLTRNYNAGAAAHLK